MKKQLIAASVSILIILAGCGKKEEQIVRFPDDSDSASVKIKTADSLMTVRHAQYRGMHMHGGDLASNAHQNVARSKRIEKELVKSYSAKKRSYQSSAERSRQRYKAYMDSLAKQDSIQKLNK